MAYKRAKRIAWAALTTAAVAALAFLVLTGKLPGLIARAGSNGQELMIEPRALSFRVDANGLLRATSVRSFGGPPPFGDYWQFQIVGIVAEGKNVNTGDVLITFEAQRIRDDQQRFQNDLDQANKEMERVKVQTDLERQELVAKLAAAENNYEKLKLKQVAGTTVGTYIDIKLDDLAVLQAKREVAARREQLEWLTKSSEANYQTKGPRAKPR